MFKLVVIAGRLRGKEFILEEGDNKLGREEENAVCLPIEGISKAHCSVTVTNEVAYLKDLGSSNGTFLNGKLTKNATIKNGDKIALPDAILQLVYVQEKKVVVKKVAISSVDEDEDTFTKPPAPPKNLLPKLVYVFRYRLMPHLHGLNKEYQWRSMIAVSLALFVFITMYLTIYPALEFGNRILISEVGARGKLYAEEIARTNAKALEKKALDQVDTSLIENNKEVSYELFDLEGRVVRPHSRLNEYIQDSFSVQARDWASRTLHKTGDTKVKLFSGGEIGIAAKVMAYNHRTGMSEAVGVIALRFKPESIQIDATTMLFLEALITAGVVALLFFGIIYFLTLRPVEEFKFKLDEAVRGSRRTVDLDLLMEELNPLRSSVNSLIQRYRESSSEVDDSDFDEVEESGPYLNTLIEFLNGASGPTMILDADKNLQRMNTPAEDITGIRESGSEGMSLLDVAREQGLAATIIELCDNSASNEGTSQSGSYELQGDDYSIHVASLIGKDNFAKCFYVTFTKDE